MGKSPKSNVVNETKVDLSQFVAKVKPLEELVAELLEKRDAVDTELKALELATVRMQGVWETRKDEYGILAYGVTVQNFRLNNAAKALDAVISELDINYPDYTKYTRDEVAELNKSEAQVNRDDQA